MWGTRQVVWGAVLDHVVQAAADEPGDRDAPEECVERIAREPAPRGNGERNPQGQGERRSVHDVIPAYR